jgi:hypothetical protein
MKEAPSELEPQRLFPDSHGTMIRLRSRLAHPRDAIH